MIYAEYVQQIKHLPFPIEEMEKRLKERPIKRYAFLVHDKDEYEDGTLKEPHVHVEIECNSSQHLETIASWFDDKPERIEKGKSKSKKFMYENMCGYLVHETESSDGKYHYDYDDVVSNFDFRALLTNAKEGIEKAKQNKRSYPIQPILDMICKNEIARIKLGDYLTYEERIRYRNQINYAYEIRDRELAREIDRTMNVSYFYGESGTGKTTFAKEFGKKQGYDVFVTGSSNDPLQGYDGQECIILDDLRGSDWKINDLIKILDNHTSSLAKSRYSNKLLADCKLMIITSVQDIEEMYKGLSNTEKEPIEQLKRRCTTMAKFTEDKIYFFSYSEGEKDYVYQTEVPNTVPLLMAAQQRPSMIDAMVDSIKDLKGVPNSVKEKVERMGNEVKQFGVIANDNECPFNEVNKNV